MVYYLPVCVTRICDPDASSPACGWLVLAEAGKYLTHSKRVALELLCFVFENCTWFPHNDHLDNLVMKNFVHLQNLCTMKFSMSSRPIPDHFNDSLEGLMRLIRNLRFR